MTPKTPKHEAAAAKTRARNDQDREAVLDSLCDDPAALMEFAKTVKMFGLRGVLETVLGTNRGELAGTAVDALFWLGMDAAIAECNRRAREAREET